MQKWKDQQLRMRQYQHQPEYLDKLLEKIPSSVNHKAFTSKSNIESMLWDDVRDVIAKSSFKQLPDKLPKRLGTPF